jgi:Transposase DNA-binding/Transposase Tn5 dimerisation domain
LTEKAAVPDWVHQEMKYIELGEKRLEKRLLKIISDFSQNPTASLPEFCGDWAATKAAYNFFKNPTSGTEPILLAQSRATRDRIKGQGRILILQDTTSFDFSHHPQTQGLGPLENVVCQGFFAHTALATTPEGVPLGLLAQQTWVRDEQTTGKRHQRHQRLIEDKESYKWLQALDDSTQGLPSETQAIVVSDRESDIFAYFVQPRPANIDLLVRARHDRRLDEASHSLFLTVSSGPVRGKVTVEVGPRPGQKPRQADCQVYYQRVKLRPPRRRAADQPQLAPVVLWAILIKEMQPPAGVEAVEWFLLSTVEIASFEQACQFIAYYACRWIIERFHFVLKSGCQIEQRQFEQADRLIRFLAVANVIAWRLLWQTYLSRVDSNLPCTVVMTEAEWKALYNFIHKTALLPQEVPTLGQVTAWIAKLGGFLGRKADGPPGVKVLWQGWRRLFDITQTWLIFNTS